MEEKAGMKEWCGGQGNGKLIPDGLFLVLTVSFQ